MFLSFLSLILGPHPKTAWQSAWLWTYADISGEEHKT